MGKFFLKKLLSSLLLLLVVTAVTFSLVFRDGPGIARRILGQNATQDQVAAKVVELGLDRPVLLQYLSWLSHAVRGNLGHSFFTGEPVTTMISARIPVTLALVLVSMFFTVVLSVLFGVVAAVKGGWIDRALQIVGVVGASIPNFVVAILLVFALAIAVHAFPATGYISPDVDPVGWVETLVLPVIAILVGAVASAAQQFRGAVIDVMNADFVRTLRSRGVNERVLVFRHVLRNAAGPGLTILSLQMISLLGGVVVIEQVFAMPGMGLFSVNVAVQGDVPAVMGSVIFTILVVVVVNIAVELLNGWINPKARLG